MKEQLPQVYNHKLRWTVVAVVVAAAFFLIWTMGLFGTPAVPEVVPVPAPAN